MSTQREKLVLELELIDKGGAAKLKRFADESDRLTGRLKGLDTQTKDLAKSKGSLLKVMRDVSVTSASLIYIIPNMTRLTWGWQASILAISAEMEKATVSLSNFQDGATRTEKLEAAEKAVDGLLKKSKQLPFEFKALQDSLVKLTTGIGEDAEPVMNGLTEALASFGASDEMLKRASVAIQQMGGKGVVSMEELRQQLGEAVPTAARLMARSLSMTYADFVKEVSQGKVSAAPAIRAMGEEMLFEAEGAAARMMSTYDGLASQIKTQFTILGKEVGDSGFFEQMKGEMKDFLTVLESQEGIEAARALGDALSSTMAAVSGGIRFVLEYREELSLLLAGFIGFKVVPGLFMGIHKQFTATATGASTLGQAVSLLRNNFARKEAIERRYASEAYLSREYNKQIAIVKQASLEMGYRRTMFTAVTNAERQMAQQLAATNVQMQKAIALKRTHNLLMSGARTIAGGLAGVVGGILVGAITAYILKLISAQGETKRLVETLNNLEASVTFGDIQNSEKELADRKAEHAKLLEEEKKFRAKMNQLQGQMQMYTAGSEGRDRVSANILWQGVKADKVAAEAKALQDEIDKLFASISSRRGEALTNSINNSFEQLQRNLAVKTEDMKEGYRKQMADLEKVFNESGSLTRMEFFQKSQAIRIESAEKEIEVYRKMVEERKKIAGDNPGEVDAGVLERMNAQLAKMEENLGKLRARKNPVDTEFKSFSSILDELNRELERTKKKTNEIDYELDYKDKFDVIVAGIEGWAKGNSDVVAVLEKIKAAYTELEQKEALLAKSKGLKAMGDTVQSLGIKYERLNLRAKDTMSNLDNEFISNRNLVSFSADVERLNNELYNLGFKARLGADNLAEGLAAIESEAKSLNLQMPETIRGIEQMRDASINADIANTSLLVQTRTEQLQKQIQKAGKESVTSYEEQRQAIDRAIAAIRAEAFATGGLTAEQNTLIANMEKLKGLYGELEAAENKQSTQFQKLAKEWSDHSAMFDQMIVNGMESFADSMANVLTGSSGNWKQWSKDMMKYIMQVIVKLTLMKVIMDSMGMTNPAAAAPAAAPGPMTYAKGGIMSSVGDVPLKKYAKGGVTGFPQRAYFGEGTKPEAYVPLPDGRTIPVTIANPKAIGPGRTQTGPVPVEVNLYNQGGEKQEADSTSRFDGERMIVDVVLRNLARPTPMRDAVRSIR